MATKPHPHALEPLIREYDQIGVWMATARDRRAELKETIVAKLFPKLKEGTNKAEVAALFVLEVNHKVKREVDGDALAAITKELVKNKVPVDDLVRWNPSLNLNPYRKLNSFQTKLFDNCLTIKPGGDDLTITALPPLK